MLSFLSFLGSCSGGHEFQKLEEGTPSVEPAAIKVQKTGIKTSPSHPLAYYYFLLSQSKLREGKVDEAIEDLKEAIAYEGKGD